MSATYRAVNWNAHKKKYDLIALSCVVLFVAVFVGVGSLVFRGDGAISAPVLAIRALGVCAVVMLHVVLMIGPMARLTQLAAPLLYNRRHLGVMTFLVALAHAALATLYYGSFGGANPLTVVLTMSGSGASPGAFPFVVPGAAALAVLFVMAATSHDFWLANLGVWWWKWLHLGVYGAYVLLVVHVSLGVMQSERSVVYPVMILIGAGMLSAMHITAGACEWKRDARTDDDVDGWIDAGALDAIPMGCAVSVRAEGITPIAVFRHEGGVSAIHGVCAHQGGPLAEGRVVGGCVTCPWHGYQYKPEDGCAPAPYDDKLATHEVKVVDGRVMVRIEGDSR
mgnify:CR=1 FL=1